MGSRRHTSRPSAAGLCGPLGVQPGTEVKADRVGMALDEPRRHLVEFLGTECDVDHEIRVDVELLVVVLERLDDRFSSGVGREWGAASGCRVPWRIASETGCLRSA